MTIVGRGRPWQWPSLGLLLGLQRLHCVVCANCEQLGQGCRSCEPWATSLVPLQELLMEPVGLCASPRSDSLSSLNFP